MRKFCIVLLLVSYMVPAVGVGVNLHWCGHILFAVSLDSDAHQNCLCAQFNDDGDDTKSECCKDDYVYYKLSQQHTASSIFSLDHFEKSPVKCFMTSFPMISLLFFESRMETYFFSDYMREESPPDILMLGGLRV
ncbi:MAG: hypothetical protein KA347_04075 [Bacteroidia bacterium]|nr:hypothetical protein [Bacteroidia bacterium]MBP7243722.1 hypothetical protein [Bacteroidia bacterium]